MRDTVSLRRKFQSLYNTQIPTGLGTRGTTPSPADAAKMNMAMIMAVVSAINPASIPAVAQNSDHEEETTDIQQDEDVDNK
jgi:hypothetical protein